MKNFYIIFNKTLITILIFLFVISTNGCESQKLSSETDRFSIASIEEERHINLPEDKVILDGAFYGSLFFYVCRDCSDVFVMDTENGGTEVFARDLDTPVCLAADSDGVFVYDYASNSVLRLDEAGEEHEVWALPELDGQAAEWYHDVDCCDGLIAAASGDKAWIVSQENGKAIPLDLSGIVFSSIQTIHIGDSKHIYVRLQTAGNGESESLLACFNSKGKRLSLLLCTGSPVCANGDSLYVFDRTSFSLYEYDGTHNEFVFWQKTLPLSYESVGLPNLVRKMFVSEKGTVIWWGTDKVLSVYPATEHEEPLVLLVSKDYLESESMVFRILGERDVVFRTFESDVFRDKLNTSLLSGESDFDLVYVSGQMDEVGGILQSIIQNGQYVDLYESPTLSDHIHQFYSGVRSLSETEGHCAFLPVSFVYSLYMINDSESELRLPFHPSFSDLCAAADKLREENLSRSLFSSLYPARSARILIDILATMVQDRYDETNGSFPDSLRDDIEAFLNTVKEYMDQGVWFGENPLLIEPFMGNLSFDDNFAAETDHASDFSYVMPASYSENLQSFIGISSFYFVNPNSANREKALALLTRITEEENIYNQDVYNAVLMPDFSRYYHSAVLSDDPIIPVEISEAYEKLEAVMGDYYDHVQLSRLNITERCRNAMTAFVKGESNSRNTAEVLYREFVYSIKG